MELAGQVVTLEADAQELRAAAARLEQDNAALQQDVGRKRQRLDGQEQALAMGRALYQEYLLRRADLEQTHARIVPRAELLGAAANAEQPLAATKPARYIALHEHAHIGDHARRHPRAVRLHRPAHLAGPQNDTHVSGCAWRAGEFRGPTPPYTELSPNDSAKRPASLSHPWSRCCFRRVVYSAPVLQRFELERNQKI